MTPPLHSADAKLGRDNVLSLLSRKDFGSFRQSLKREHIHTEYAGNNSLLHYAVTSRDAASVEHVLNLGADVNTTTVRGYTPLIVAVLHRYKWRLFFLSFNGWVEDMAKIVCLFTFLRRFPMA